MRTMDHNKRQRIEQLRKTVKPIHQCDVGATQDKAPLRLAAWIAASLIRVPRRWWDMRKARRQLNDQIRLLWSGMPDDSILYKQEDTTAQRLAIGQAILAQVRWLENNRFASEVSLDRILQQSPFMLRRFSAYYLRERNRTIWHFGGQPYTSNFPEYPDYLQLLWYAIYLNQKEQRPYFILPDQWYQEPWYIAISNSVTAVLRDERKQQPGP